MKKLFPFILSTLILTASCSKEKGSLSPISSEENDIALSNDLDDLTYTPRTETFSFDANTPPFLTKIDAQKLKILRDIQSPALQQGEPSWSDPLYVKGNDHLYESNYKVRLNSTVIPGLDDGVYWCDIYVYSTTVSLPGNSIAKIIPTDKDGLNSFVSFTKGSKGSQSVENGKNTFFMETYVVKVRFNAIGEPVDLYYPLDPSNMEFAYAYSTY